MTIELFSEVNSCEEFQDVVVENKKSFWGERIGDCSFGGAGGKAILLNTPNGKEFVSYEQAFNGKGKYGKLLHSFFFGASEEDKLSVTDILNLIDENLSDSDIELLRETLFNDDESPFKLQIGDVFGGVGLDRAINVQEYYDEYSNELKAVLKSGESDKKLLAKDLLKNHKELIMGEAICRYMNTYYDFMKHDFKFNIFEDGISENIHLVKFGKSDRPYIRRLASDDFVLYSTKDVDALAKLVDLHEDGYRLELRLIL